MKRRGSLLRDANLALLALGALALHSLGAGRAEALDYVDSSPSGAAFPEWEGGDTELEFADIDGDGHVDFLSIGDHGSPFINTDQHGIMCYFGDGAGGWSVHQEGNFGYGGIAVGDVDNDGFLDVGYGMHHDYSGTDFGDQLIEVVRGDGSGTAWTPGDDGLGSGGETYGMFASDFADMDNDGDLDLASHSFGCCNGPHVYRNDGGGQWTHTWSLPGANARASLGWGDVNGDGVADFAASYQSGTIYLGDGEGSFTVADAGLPAAGLLGLAGVHLGDVNGDGCADLAFTRNGGVFVYFWQGGSWVSASGGLPASGGYEVAQLWDMDVDGFVDVAALGSGTCTVWLGDGAGSWTAGGGITKGPAVDTAAFRAGGDVDRNGFPDLVFLQEEDVGPTYRNVLYVFRESSVPAARFARFQFPRGNEAFYEGSVQTIRWSSAQVGSSPATAALELSTNGPGGPWTPVASGLPDNGAYQWIVSGPPTDTACLKLVVTQGSESATALSSQFRILAGGATGALAAAPAVERLTAWPNPSRGRVRFRLAGGGAIALYD
ncbi:MAG: FG-GAP repeat domain-containing protein, partial [bacterium]